MPPTDRGSTSLATVLLTPVFLVLAFTAFQAALFTHARTEARSVARDAAVLVARQGATPDAVEASAEDVLRSAELISGGDVDIRLEGQLVVVRLTADAPGILRGTQVDLEITESLPLEGFRP